MTEKTEFEYPKIRDLTRKDRRKLSELIQAFANRSGNIRLTEMVPAAKPDGSDSGDEAAPDAETDQLYETIKNVLDGIIEWAEAEVAAWFMDLIGCQDRAEYDAMPFDIEVNIIDQLMDKKGFTGFFSQASGLYNKIRGLIENR